MSFVHTHLFLLVICLACLFSCQRAAPSVPEEFEIAEGFDLDLVAAEPLIRDPVDLEFNEFGDALVLEMPGYPYEDRQSRLLVLKDTNQDGIYDKQAVFADDLQLASSIMPWRKGVLVAAPPYLLFVRDDNQDYSPEGIDTLMGGFSTGNLQHNYNGLTLGMDGWIYAANGGNDGSPYWWGDSLNAMDLRGQDFRFNPDTRELERLGESSGGFELAMDPYGRIFETHNLEHISHLVFPDRYIQGKQLLKGHTLENISNHEENGLARIYPIGEQETRVNHPEQSGYFSGACGITYYDGGSFGPDYAHTVWVADVVLNLIHIDKIAPHGASYSASRTLDNRDFLASKDRSFRPVNMTVGPDGAMYIVDMYRDVIEHPEWIPDEIEKTLDLNAGKDKGRIYRVRKSETDYEPFDRNLFTGSEKQARALTHPNQWVRMTAHRLLLVQKLSPPVADILKQYLSSDNIKAYIHALYILNNARQLDASELREALASGQPEVCETALKISEDQQWESSGARDWIRPLLTHEVPRVRMQAALTLSRLNLFSADTLRSGDDHWQTMLVSAGLPQDDWTAAALTLAASGQEAAFMTALSRSANPDAGLMVSLAGQCGKDAESVRLVLNSLYSTDLPPSARRRIIQELGKNAVAFDPQPLLPVLARFENDLNQSYLLPELARLRDRLDLPVSPAFVQFSRQALQEAPDSSLPDSARLSSLQLIELLPYRDKSEVLYACLENTEPLVIQEAALRQLAAFPEEKEIGQRIVANWNELSPSTRRYASDLLLYLEIHHDALLTGLETGAINIGEMNFDLERRRMLLDWTDDETTRRRAAVLFSDAGVSTRREAIDQMKPALRLEGVATAGSRVFDQLCSKCHVYGSAGTEVGPVLTEINRKSRETLLYDIVDPNAAVDPKYINHLLETVQGQVHTGIISTETDDYITIRKVGGEMVTVPRKDIKSFRSLGTSLMMEGLESALSVQEMADLLAFLQNGTKS